MAKSISLPKCNLYLIGSGLDRNGNKIVKLTFPNTRGFSIQTGGNLPKTSNILRGKKTFLDMQSLSKSELKTIASEVCRYVKKYGSPNQQKKLRTY